MYYPLTVRLAKDFACFSLNVVNMGSRDICLGGWSVSAGGRRLFEFPPGAVVKSVAPNSIQIVATEGKNGPTTWHAGLELLRSLLASRSELSFCVPDGRIAYSCPVDDLTRGFEEEIARELAEASAELCTEDRGTVSSTVLDIDSAGPVITEPSRYTRKQAAGLTSAPAWQETVCRRKARC